MKLYAVMLEYLGDDVPFDYPQFKVFCETQHAALEKADYLNAHKILPTERYYVKYCGEIE